jgi:hypothetical protein
VTCKRRHQAAGQAPALSIVDGGLRVLLLLEDRRMGNTRCGDGPGSQVWISTQTRSLFPDAIKFKIGISTLNPDTKQSIYRYRGNWSIFLFLIAFTGLFLVLGSQDVRRYALVVTLVLGLAWMIAVLVLMSRSDVIIDERGIARSILGIQWRRMEWANVAVMRGFPVASGQQERVRGYNICPRSSALEGASHFGKISFTSYIVGIGALIDELNTYAIRYRIAIEIRQSLFGPFVGGQRLV